MHLNELQFNFLYDGNCFRRLLEQQKQHVRSDNLKISYKGIRINSLEEYFLHFKDIGLESLKENQIRIYIQHFDKLSERLPFVNYLNFNEFESVLTELSDNFFRKLNNLNRVTVNRQVNDESMFMKFIKRCETFPSLSFENCKLSQSFFDRLPYDCWFIQILVLSKNICTDELNHDFVLKLKYLNTLRLAKKIDLDFIKQIYSNLKYLKDFFLNHQSGTFSISVSDNQINLFRFSTKTCFNNLNEVFEYFEYLNSNKLK
jgi:hypothetical protein